MQDPSLSAGKIIERMPVSILKESEVDKSLVAETHSGDVGEKPPIKLSEDMQDAWIAFARTGNPSHKNIPDWPTYNPETRPTMKFGDTYEVLEDPLAWVRDLGDEIDRMLGLSQ